MISLYHIIYSTGNTGNIKPIPNRLYCTWIGYTYC